MSLIASAYWVLEHYWSWQVFGQPLTLIIHITSPAVMFYCRINLWNFSLFVRWEFIWCLTALLLWVLLVSVISWRVSMKAGTRWQVEDGDLSPQNAPRWSNSDKTFPHLEKHQISVYFLMFHWWVKREQMHFEKRLKAPRQWTPEVQRQPECLLKVTLPPPRCSL